MSKEKEWKFGVQKVASVPLSEIEPEDIELFKKNIGYLPCLYANKEHGWFLMYCYASTETEKAKFQKHLGGLGFSYKLLELWNRLNAQNFTFAVLSKNARAIIKNPPETVEPEGEPKIRRVIAMENHP
jgi:hypothetical protein